MKTTIKLVSTSVALALTSASSYSFAQQPTEQATTADDVELIQVFAQKRPQNLEDLPVATTVLSERDIIDAGIAGPSDLQRLAPSVSFGDSVTSRARSTFIRGLGTQSFSDGVETSVGTFVDGVIMGRDFMGFSEFNDILQVEVLRGPQGTVFGKGSSAGLIHVVTMQPSFSEEGKASVSYGSDNEVRANATYSNALTDDLAGRISVYHSSRDGIIDNQVLGRETNDKKGQGVRGKLLYTPSADLEVIFAADYQRTDEECCELTFRDIPPPNAALPPQLQALTAFGAISVAGFNPGDIANQFISVNNQATGEEIDNFGGSIDVNFETNDHRFVSITAYRKGDIFEFNGADNVPLTFLDIASTDSESTQFTQEFRIESLDSGQALNYVLGLYYFDNDVDSVQRFDEVDLVSFGLVPQVPKTSQQTLHGSSSTNYAVFGEGNYKFNDSFAMTLGLRYARDEVDGYVDRTSTVSFFPTAGPFTADADETEMSGRVSLEYSFGDNELLYTSYSRGYKGPAIQVDPLFNAAPGTTLPVVAPELVDAFELGLRGIAFDKALRYGISIFSTDVKDLQAASFDPQALGFLLQNVGEANTQGIEVEFDWQITEAFSFSGFVSQMNAEIDSFPGATCYPGQTEALGCINGIQDLSGSDLPNAPDLSARLNLNYSSGDWSANMGYSWRDDIQYSLNGNPRTIQEAYGLLDANIEYYINDKYSISLFGNNLTDKQYAAFIANSLHTTFLGGTTGDTSTVQVLARGRSVGIRLTAAF